MKERSFLDTSVLLATDDTQAPEKQALALALLQAGWASGHAVISTQVLREYFSASTQKLGIPIDLAQRKIELMASQMEVISIDSEDILQAIELNKAQAFSFWEALIIRMAQKSECRVLYSDVIQAERSLAGLQIINPFQSANNSKPS
ncbi:PIN domain-containing protein [Thiothrix eikelboomii]|uniref:Predicted nucleic acid-binding protein, contains PIN domain n=1 Tax=Thiothrix eikelboomii TaxID=92487 RepID=A0A1T4WCD9_9GAMM|nr:PIN domain-containing protein [Thiothrix eikelboomii]SKA74950.1 Predicted nucleic acid-binding protein, contains PIN domain [Thiothrix eikelboomii]